MFRSIQRIDFSDFTLAVPAFLMLLLMPLTYNISTGLAFGFVAHVLLHCLTGRIREIHPVMWCVGALSAVDLIVRNL